MRRSIGVLILTLFIGVFGLIWGGEPAHGACTQLVPGGNEYECNQTDGSSQGFGHITNPFITVKGTARTGQLSHFYGGTMLIEEGARVTTWDNVIGLWATDLGPGGNTVENHGDVTSIRLDGNNNHITNYGVFRPTEGNGFWRVVGISGDNSTLTNKASGVIYGRTAVLATNVRSIDNDGLIEGSDRAIDIQGSSDNLSTIITNTGIIKNTSGGVAIRRSSSHSRRVSVVNTTSNDSTGEIVGHIELLGSGLSYVNNDEGAKIDGNVSFGSNGDWLENAGLITGTVNMGSGDDLVENEVGAIIEGNVLLGSGNDTLTNAGRIEGAVTAGAGTSHITNDGFIGRVSLGAGDDTVINSADGIVDGNVGLGGGDDVLTNYGTIEGVVTASAGTSMITNEGSIAGVNLGVGAASGNDTLDNNEEGIISGDVNMGDGTDTVINAGTISGQVDLGGGDASIDSNTLTNSGLIAGDVLGGDIENIVTNKDGGEIAGDVTLGSGDDKVTNEEGGLIRGDVDLGDGQNVAENSGVIRGDVIGGDDQDDITNKATGVILRGVDLGGGDDDSLLNEGRIEGTVTAGVGTSTITNSNFIDRIRLGAGNDKVINTGLIAGNVDTGDGDNTLENSGSIEGNILTGTGTDVVDIQGKLLGSLSGGTGVDIVTVGSDAQVIGNILLGAGDDQLILQNWDGDQILGMMDGGAGDDRLILEGGEGTLLTSGFNNFENVTVRDGGEWTISGSIPTSGGVLTTSKFAALWLEGDANTVTYAEGNTFSVEADRGTGVLVGGDDNAFTNAGGVDVVGDDAIGVSIEGSGNITLNATSGSIGVEGTRAGGLLVWGADNVSTNEGSIQASGKSAYGIGISGSNNTTTNTETGTIAVDGEGAVGVQIGGNENEFINAGLISAEGEGAIGASIQGADNTFENSGTIEASGDDKVTAVQINSTDASAGANVITNTGTIQAESGSGDAKGIVTTGAGKTQIHNLFGALIEADIAIHADGLGEYSIDNDGTIRGDIVLGDGDHIVQNDGDIFGDIRLGDGNHQITNDGFLSGDIDLSQSKGDHKVELVEGSLWDPGVIHLGVGDDELTYSTVANDMTDQHKLDGGDGDDTLILVDDGYLNLYEIVNFETLELRDNGTWRFNEDVDFDNHITADEGHLILGNARNGGIEFGTGGLTIGSAARLSGAGTITGDVTIEGAVAPGYSHGTLNVIGDYTQADNSTYGLDMFTDGTSDLIHATGAATIGNNAKLDITAEECDCKLPPRGIKVTDLREN